MTTMDMVMAAMATHTEEAITTHMEDMDLMDILTDIMEDITHTIIWVIMDMDMGASFGNVIKKLTLIYYSVYNTLSLSPNISYIVL